MALHYLCRTRLKMQALSIHRCTVGSKNIDKAADDSRASSDFAPTACWSTDVASARRNSDRGGHDSIWTKKRATSDLGTGRQPRIMETFPGRLFAKKGHRSHLQKASTATSAKLPAMGSELEGKKWNKKETS